MRRAFPLMVVGAALLAFLLRFDGVAGGELRGFDSGEYLAIINDLVRGGFIPADYWGFGQTYSEFPGFMALVGAVSLVCGVPASEALPVAGPLLGALAVGLVALVAHRITGNEAASALASLFVATFFAVGASTSISKPSVLGGFLYLLALLLLLRSKRRSSMAGACLVSTAIVVSHHLSTLFLAATASVGLLWLLASRDDERSLPAEAGLSLGLIAAAFAYWRFVPERFWGATFASMDLPWWVVLAGLALPAIVGLALHLSRVAGTHPLRLPVSPWLTLAALVVATAAVVGIYIAGTTPGQRLGENWVYLLGIPAVCLAIFSAFGFPRAVNGGKGGGVLIWMLVPLGASAAVVVYENTFLLPHRPLEYAFPLLGALLAVAIAEAQERVDGTRIARAALPVAIVALLLLSMPSTVPRDELLGGPTALSTPDEVAGALWLGGAVPSDCLVAADHRTSALVYCYSGVNATWYYAQDYLTAEAFNRSDYIGLDVPAGDNASIRAVYLTAKMEDGYLRAPWQGYGIMTDAEKAKFSEVPFIAVFQNSGGAVYLAAY